jgi:hypothetical protein
MPLKNLRYAHHGGMAHISRASSADRQFMHVTVGAVFLMSAQASSTVGPLVTAVLHRRIGNKSTNSMSAVKIPTKK